MGEASPRPRDRPNSPRAMRQRRARLVQAKMTRTRKSLTAQTRILRVDDQQTISARRWKTPQDIDRRPAQMAHRAHQPRRLAVPAGINPAESPNSISPIRPRARDFAARQPGLTSYCNGVLVAPSECLCGLGVRLRFSIRVAFASFGSTQSTSNRSTACVSVRLLCNADLAFVSKRFRFSILPLGFPLAAAES